MLENQEPTPEQIAAALQLQDKFSRAYPSQDTLEYIPTEVLPIEYRKNIVLRQDENNLYFAFSDNPEDLHVTWEGYMPNAHIRQISVMNGPRRTGTVIKECIDKVREAESKK